MIRWMLAKLGLFTDETTQRRVIAAKLALCESPMERRFLIAADPMLSQYGELIPQYRLFNYRADFAIPDCLIVIEIDGYDWHKTKEQLTSDSRRQRELTAAGWCVVRFTGQEIYADAAGCAAEVEWIINRRSGRG